jgi:hypothetical protein
MKYGTNVENPDREMHIIRRSPTLSTRKDFVTIDGVTDRTWKWRSLGRQPRCYWTGRRKQIRPSEWAQRLPHLTTRMTESSPFGDRRRRGWRQGSVCLPEATVSGDSHNGMEIDLSNRGGAESNASTSL